MLLIIEAVLLISAALGQDHRAAKEKILPLDMAINSVDDLYYGCREKTSKLVETKYLKEELKNSTEFKMVWEIGTKNVTHWNFVSELKKTHKVAIYAYTYTQPNLKIYLKFNNDTRNGKQNYTIMKYEWYSLHFLLTEATHILKKTQNRCFNTFRGTNAQFENDVLNKVIRFGSFTSATLDIYIAKRFGSKSCFEIHTCEGANITKYSKFPLEKEVLIPPYEMFNVTEVKTKRGGKLWCDTVYVLKSTGIRSDLNCALFNEPKP